MEEKIASIKKEYREITQEISSPGAIQNQGNFAKLSKRHIQLKETVDTADALETARKKIAENKEILVGKDSELAQLAQDELGLLEQEQRNLTDKLKILLLPKDPADSKDAIVEIRAGAGGDEAGLFAADLLRMYLRLAQNQRWQTEIMSENKSGVGGFKEVIFKVASKDMSNPPYAKMKYESGVHRVQRVPETESGGRIHTSTATVAVLPEAEEVDIDIDPKDIKIDVFRSSGPGGQSVNTTDSAVRITHVPSGITVSCQDEKSQHKNKAKAMNILRSRLLAQRQEEEEKKRGTERRTQVGSGDRSEKIRTYNFPQDRMTDHRIKYSVHGLEKIMNGEIEPLLAALVKEDQKLKMEKA